MSTDALLTLAAAVIAVLTLMSPEARADPRLRVTPFTGLVVALAFLILVAIKLTPVWVALGWRVLGPWRWGFDPEVASFTTIMVAAAIILLRVGTVRLSPRRINAFAELSERLLFAGKHSELLFLLERHFDALERLVESNYVTSRLRKRLTPSRFEVFVGDRRAGGSETMAEWKAKQRHPLIRFRRGLVKLLPDHEERQSRGKRLLERVFLSESFVEYLSKARPDFAPRVLDVNVPFFREAFLQVLIAAWMKNRHSVLFEETQQNQSLRGGHRYRFEPLNPILWYFFGGTAFRADDLHIYKPIGDFVSDELTRLRRHPDEDWHRAPADNFSDDGKWRSPIHLGIRLFDFWIGEGLHRGIHWHGWLMYLESWTRGIVANMGNLGADVDHDREFPTGYHYLLYEIFGTLEHWIEDATRVDQSLPSVEIDKVEMQFDTIAKAAIVTLGGCLRVVVESANVRPEFKGYLLGIVLRQYEDVVKHDQMKQLYQMAITEGGLRFGGPESYYGGLRQALSFVNRERLYGEPGDELYRLLFPLFGLRTGDSA